MDRLKPSFKYVLLNIVYIISGKETETASNSLSKPVQCKKDLLAQIRAFMSVVHL